MHDNALSSFLKIYWITGLSGFSDSYLRYTSCVQAYVFLEKNISGHDYEAQCILKTTDIDYHLQIEADNEKSAGS